MARRTPLIGFGVAGLVIALALAFFVSPHASSSPDGLEKVAADRGLDRNAKAHAMTDSPLADYSVKGVADTGLSTGLAGLIGVLATFVVGYGVFSLVKKPRHQPDRSTAPTGP
jgi:cobalt/nickel transport system permease protein